MKYGLRVLLLLSLFLGCFAVLPARAAVALPDLMGDVDGDGRIGIKDVISVLKIAAGLTVPNERESFLGDVAPRPGVGGLPAGDGVVNIRDVIAILKVVAGLTDPASLGNDEVMARLSPASVFLAPGGQTAFTVMAVGPISAPPVWSVAGTDAGQIDQNGIYTAPAHNALATVKVEVGGLILESTVFVDDSTPPPPPTG
ncbi:MAG TPA: hypothetical protein VGN26_04915 [Armatimonadota bacterium]